MVTAKVNRTKNVSSYQPNNNISERVYKSQRYTNLNLNSNDNETTHTQRHIVTNKNDDINNPFQIFHQNIRGLKGKANELMLQLLAEAPHLICLTEHHLKNYELDVTPIPKYKLGANCCRKTLKNGGVCIYIQENLKFTNINLQKHCKEQDMEIAAIQLKLNKKNTVILCVYRAPSGDFNYFLNKLDNILDSLHNHKTELIICGDININYLENNNKKKQLDYLLGTYNLIDTVYFPTRTTNNSATLIDNIFIDNRRNYSIKPCINGLSDHDAQLITLSNIALPISSSEPTYIRNINKSTIAEFQLQLSGEQWDNIFGNDNVNEMFNHFLNTFLRYYYSCFPKKEIKSNNTHNQWITRGIKISCKRKKELFLLCKHSNDLNLKLYYKRYCAVLSKVIFTAKKLHYNNIILNSENKMKSTWKIINEERGKTKRDIDIQSLVLDNNVITDQNQIANTLNTYFLSIADSINSNNNKSVNTNLTNPISYLTNSFGKPFTKISWQYASTYEVENIIKSLKTKNSCGYDEVSNRIIKFSAPFIISPLTYICNAILRTGTFPDRLKYAIVKPVFKKGNRQEISNYRPISLLTSFFQNY